ncbi:hypothetical protein DMN91_005192, partial [Ooceraea biroi]
EKNCYGKRRGLFWKQTFFQRKAIHVINKLDERYVSQQIEELRQQPSCDLRALVFENVKKIEGTVQVSSNIKGTCQKRLRDAALNVKVVMSVLTERDNDNGEGENAALQREVCSLRAEVEKLKKVIEELQNKPTIAQRNDETDAEIQQTKASAQPVERRSRQQRRTQGRRYPSLSFSPDRNTETEDASVQEYRTKDPIQALEDRLLTCISTMIEQKFSEMTMDVQSKPAAKTQNATVIQKSQRSTSHGSQSAISTNRKDDNVDYRRSSIIAQPVETWVQVVKKNKKKKAGASSQLDHKQQKVVTVAKITNTKDKVTKPKLNPPKTAAISITALDGKYAESLFKAQQEAKPEEFGIVNMRAKRSVTGGYIFEVPGPDGNEKANAFANRLQEVFKDSNVKVARPSRKIDIRVCRLVDSTTPTDVANAIALKFSCQTSEINTGVIRRAPNGLGDLWVRIPVEMGETLIKENRLQVGWTTATIMRLEPRKLHCFRCLQPGHVKIKCPNEDHSNLCFRCGEPGHIARYCEARATCYPCKVRGLPTSHRMGGHACPPITKQERRQAGDQRGLGAANGRQVPEDQPVPSSSASKEGDPVKKVTVREEETLTLCEDESSMDVDTEVVQPPKEQCLSKRLRKEAARGEGTPVPLPSKQWAGGGGASPGRRVNRWWPGSCWGIGPPVTEPTERLVEGTGTPSPPLRQR